MTSPNFSIRPERTADATAIDTLVQMVFGPGSKARAAYALRENVSPEIALSFVAERDGKLVGSVRQTRILWGDQTALMLGPLGVLSDCANLGIGKALMRTSVDAARQIAEHGGESVVMLVGDLAYYAPFGFEQIPPGQITMPRPADPMRVLACELKSGALGKHSGPASRILA